jgi:hypothetical protein
MFMICASGIDIVHGQGTASLVYSHTSDQPMRSSNSASSGPGKDVAGQSSKDAATSRKAPVLILDPATARPTWISA